MSALSRTDASREPLHALTGVRVLAVLMVLFHHRMPTGPESLGPLADRLHWVGSIGVGWFFVLSGFAMAYGYSESARLDRHWLAAYFRNRFARLFPVLGVLTLLTYGGWQNDFPFWLSLTGTQGFFSAFRYSGITQVWSLTVELTFYCLAPAIFIFGRGRRLFAAWIAMPLVGLALVRLAPHTQSFFVNVPFALLFTFFGRCSEFFVGILLARYLMGRKSGETSAFPWRTVVGAAGTAALVGVLAALPTPGWMARATSLGINGDPILTTPGAVLELLVLPIFSALFYAGLVLERTRVARFFAHPTMVLAGRSTYVFYLIHVGVVNDTLEAWLTRDFWALLALEMLISLITYRCFEEPLNRLLRGEWRPTLPRGRTLLAYLPFAALALLVLTPILGQNYVGDEIAWAGRRANAVWNHYSPWTAGLTIHGGWRGVGRFYPLDAIYTWTVFTGLDPGAVRWLFITIVMAAHLTLFALLRQLNVGARSAAVLTLVCLVTFPVQQGGVAMQVIMLKWFLSLLSFAVYLKQGSRGAFWFSMLLLALLSMTYEACYPLFLGHFAICRALGRSLRASARELATAFAASAIPAVYSVVLRAHLPVDRIYEGVQISHSVTGYLSLLAKHSLAAIPLFLAIFGEPLSYLRAPDYAIGVAVATLVLLLSLRRREPRHLAEPRPPRAIVAALWLAPALVFSLSARYQTEIGFGGAYLPAFLQAYGGSLLGGCLILALWRRGRPRLAIVGIAVLALVTSQRNARMIDYYNSFTPERTALLHTVERGMRGILDARPILAHVAYRNQEDLEAVVFRYVGRRIPILFEKPPQGPVTVYQVVGPMFNVEPSALYVHADAVSRDGQFVHAREVRIFGPRAPYAVLDTVAPDGAREGAVVVGTGDPDEQRAMLPEDGRWIKIEAISFSRRTKAISLAFDRGFSPLERRPGRSWRWSDREGRLCVTNADARPRTIDFAGVLWAAGGDMAIAWQKGRDVIHLGERRNAKWERRLEIFPGTQCFQFAASGPQVMAPRDQRKLFFRLEELTMKVH